MGSSRPTPWSGGVSGSGPVHQQMSHRRDARCVRPSAHRGDHTAGRCERCDARLTHRNGTRTRTLSNEAEDLTVGIPKSRKGSFFPEMLESRRPIDILPVSLRRTMPIDRRPCAVRAHVLTELTGIGPGERPSRHASALQIRCHRIVQESPSSRTVNDRDRCAAIAGRWLKHRVCVR